MAKPAILQEQPDFSLVLGGPLYQLFRRARLSGDALELVRRRVLIISCVAWLPLLLLSVFAGQALGGTIAIPFFHDIEAHVRFLIALPILIAAEVAVHRHIRPVVALFVEGRVVIPEDMPRFHQAISSTSRWRNSVTAEIAILVFVYTLGLWGTNQQLAALNTASWYAMPDGAQMHLTPAGYWYAFVSVPIFQFILLRWYFRFLLWFRFLWRVSRLNLRLTVTHPDRAAGLGFLSRSIHAFAPILFAQSALLAGLIASLILFAGHDLMAFKGQVAVFLGFFIAIILSPLTVFAPSLSRAKWQGLCDVDRLASRYAGEFEDKWVKGGMRGGAPVDEQLLGSADIQSLADLGNSYAVVQGMRLVPFGLKDVTVLVAAMAVPLLPLTLTIFSLEELLSHVIKVIF